MILYVVLGWLALCFGVVAFMGFWGYVRSWRMHRREERMVGLLFVRGLHEIEDFLDQRQAGSL